MKFHPKHLVKRIKNIDATPKAIAIGVACGIFFGFTPLFGLKTLLAIGVAWLFRGSKIAAAVAVSLHDLFLPLLPFLMRLEYDIGFVILDSSHQLPPHLQVHDLKFHEWFQWNTFIGVGSPMLLGSIILGIPLAIVAYYATFWIVKKEEAFLDSDQNESSPKS